MLPRRTLQSHRLTHREWWSKHLTTESLVIHTSQLTIKRLEAADYGYFRISEPSGGQGELHGRGDRPHQEEGGVISLKLTHGSMMPFQLVEHWQISLSFLRQIVSYFSIWQGCYCSRKLSPIEGRFSKWFSIVKKGVLEHCLSFAGNSRSTSIYQLWAGKTRSKRSSTPPFVYIFWILSA